MLSVLAFADPAAASQLTPAQVQAQQWWITRLDLQKTWAVSQGSGVTIALLDTGVDGNFGDLKGALVPGFVAGGSGDGLTDTDPEQHGTNMADDIAGRGTGFGLLGVAKRTKIMPVTIGVDPGGAQTAAAINRIAAMARPPAVINMSYGHVGSCPAGEAAAVVTALRRGIIVVASAGNTGATTNDTQYPSNCPGVVAVGAIDETGNPWSDSQRQSYVSLAAPGVKIIAADDRTPSGFGYATGTSDSAAMVSATFAVLRAHFPHDTARALVARVFYTAKQYQGAAHSRNITTGYGIARPLHAMQDSVPASAPNPVYDAVGLTAANPTGSATASKTPPTSPTASSPSAASTPPTSAPVSGTQTVSQAGASGGGGTSTGLIVAIIAAVVIVLALIVGLILRSRRRTPQPAAASGGYPPPPPGGSGYGPPGSGGGGYGPSP